MLQSTDKIIDNVVQIPGYKNNVKVAYANKCLIRAFFTNDIFNHYKNAYGCTTHYNP